MEAGSVVVRVRADIGQFSAGMATASAQMNSLGSRMNRAGKSIAGFGKSMTRGVTLPIVAVGAAMTKLSYDFDKSMGQIASLVGASAKDMKTYRSTVLQMAKDTGKAPKELAEALYFVTSSGFKGASALKVLEASAKASAAGLGSTKTVADAVTSAVNAYGEKNLSAARATDILVAAVREGKAEPEELAGAIGRVIAPAQAMGVEFHEVAGALAAMSMVGLDASEGTTALRGTLMSILKPAQETRDFLRENGESLAGIRKELSEKGLLPTLERLAEKFKGNQDAIGTLFPNVRALNGVLALTGKNAEKTAGVMDNVARAFGDTSRAFAERQKQDSFKVQQAWATIQASMIRVGGTVLPIVANAGVQLAGVIERLAGAFGRLSPFQQKLVLFGAVAAAALGPLVGLIGNVVRAIGGLSTAVGFLVTNPWVLVLVGLGVAAAALSGKFDIASGASRNLASAMRDQASAAQTLRGALVDLDGSNLALAQAQQNVVTSLHTAQAAQRDYNRIAADGKAKTLEGKQAHDQAVTAWQAHRRAVIDLNAAQEANTAAQTKANKEVAGMLPMLTRLNAEITKVGDVFGGPKGAEAARGWGMEMQKAGQAAFKASFDLKGASPAAQAAQRSFATLQTAAGTLARQLGRMPTKKEIIAQAKLQGGPAFIDGLKGFVKAAQKAGVEVPKWILSAVAPSKANAQKVVAGVGAQAGAAAGAGRAVGSALGSGMVAGIGSQIGAAVAMARTLVQSAVAAAYAAAGNPHSPAPVTVPLGKAFVEGLADGIIRNQGLADDAAKKAAQRTAAMMQAGDLVVFIRQAGKTIGLENAKGIVEGLVQGTPSLLAQAREAARQMAGEMRQKIADARGEFATTFRDLAQAALDAFDQKMSEWKPPAQRLLDKMKLKDEVRQADETLASAMAQVMGGGSALADQLSGPLSTSIGEAMNRAMSSISGAKTEEALNRVSVQAQRGVANAITQASAGALTQANQAIGAAQAELAAAEASGDTERITKAREALDTAVTNRDNLEAAIRGRIEAATQQLVPLEQKRHDQLAGKQRAGLARQFIELQNKLRENPKAWNTMGEEVKKILAKFHVPMVNAGKKWAEKFAEGIREKIPEAENAARELATAVKKITDKALTGSPKYATFYYGQDWVKQFGEGMKTAIVSPELSAETAPLPSLSGGGGGGGMTIVNLNVSGSLIHQRELEDVIALSAQNWTKRNGPMFTRTVGAAA